ncbi:MAG: hypothetical protein ACRELG_09195, partial [Gemmataceae bacterium]
VSPAVLMYVWDGVVVAFLFSWAAGLLAELQRSESLSLEKFLHLPVSLSSAFLINYLSSLASVSLLLFLPAMLGLSLGLLISRGWAMLLLLPMLAAFLLMVTALTYQFQGWLATLMANPRRRRTIIVAATMIFILLFQVPNLVNIMHGGRIRQSLDEQTTRRIQESQEYAEADKDYLRSLSLPKSEQEHNEDRKKHKQRREAIQRKHAAQKQELEEQESHQVEETAKLLNLIQPPGWLPVGVEAAAEGRPWPILLAILGPALIGTFSLWRAYRTTVRLYTGQYTSGAIQAVAAPPAKTPSSATRLLERKLPWLSEQAAVIALAAFRSLLRAPEAKMLLLTPLVMLVIFGSMVLTRDLTDVPQAVRPLLAFGAMALILFNFAQLIGNQFGFDRNGFRVFVLCPARRRDILLGKNLAVAPLAFSLGAAAVIGVQVICPMRVDRFLALAPRFVSMYLLYCLPANAMSILAPTRIAAGSFKAAQTSGIAILWQVLFMFLCPAVLAPTLLPLGIAWAVEEMGWRHGMPLDLMLSVLECAAIIYFYGLVLRWQGEWLQMREQRILQIVTIRAE